MIHRPLRPSHAVSLLGLLAAMPALAQDDGSGCPGGSLTLDAPSLRLSGGSVSFQGDAAVSVLDSGLSVSGGRATLVTTGGKAAVEGAYVATDSKLSVTGGDVQFHGQSTLDLSDSSLKIDGGSLSLFGEAVSVCTDGSRAVVGASGRLTGAGSSSLSFVEDSRLVVDGGSVVFTDSSSVDLGAGSTLKVDGGTLEMSDASSLRISPSGTVVVDGDLRLAGTSSVTAGKGSTLKLTGVTKAAELATVEVAGGAVAVLGPAAFGGSARLDLGDGSTIRVTGGDLVLSDEAAFRVGSGARLRFVEAKLSTVDPAFDAAALARLLAACPTAAIVRSRKDGLLLTCERSDADPGTCPDFLSAKREPPVWKCEDECLQTDKGTVCGTTSHF